MRPSVRILLCDDQTEVRLRVRAALEKSSVFEVVGEAGTAAECVALSLERVPDVVLMDILLPDFSGIEATRQILARAPSIKVLAFSSDSRQETSDEMFSAGACGYVVKTGLLGELVHAILTVSTGGRFLDQGVGKPTA